ncbi:hypothetical protein B0H19DRAFT_1377472 [Mycena capillaripes]|nr:hypothetical protein B0H19DRAFT_1377472 [Mycena capillaripes]
MSHAIFLPPSVSRALISAPLIALLSLRADTAVSLSTSNTSALEGLEKRDQFVGQFGGCCWEAASYNYNRKSTVATCVDECATCDVTGSIGIIEGLFTTSLAEAALTCASSTAPGPLSTATTTRSALFAEKDLHNYEPYEYTTYERRAVSTPYTRLLIGTTVAGKMQSIGRRYASSLLADILQNLGKLKAALVNRYERYSRSGAIKMNAAPALLSSFCFIPVIPWPHTCLLHLLPFVSTRTHPFPSAFPCSPSTFVSDTHQLVHSVQQQQQPMRKASQVLRTAVQQATVEQLAG